MASPSPVPLPRSLVVKKGSKMRGRSSGGMPLPVSLTVKRTPSVIFSNFEVAGKVSFSVFFRLEAECSSCGHRVARIHRQIQQDLLHLIAVRHDPAEISTGPNVNMNVLTDEAGKKIGYFHNGVVKVEDRRLEDLLAAESQQLAHEGLRAVRALHDFRYFAAETVITGLGWKGQLRIAADDGQKIVEIVRDTTGKPAERLHFLRLTELLFERGDFRFGAFVFGTDAQGRNAVGKIRGKFPEQSHFFSVKDIFFL